MKSLKKMVALLLSVCMLVGVVAPVSATGSVEKKDISACTITVSELVYDGTAQTPTVTVKDGETTLSTSDYTVAVEAQVNSGDYTLTVTGINHYEGSVEVAWSIKPSEVKKPSANKMVVNKKTVTYKASDLKKKAKKIKLQVKLKKKLKGATITFKVKKAKANAKYIKVNKKGVIKLKKGIKKGTYKVKVIASAYNQFKKLKKVVKIKIK